LQLVVITQEEQRDGEPEIAEKLFKLGLEVLHIRKPEFSTKQMEDYLKKYPEKYRNRLVLHSHHELAAKMKLRGIHLTEAHRKNKFMLSIKLWYYRNFHKNITISASYHQVRSLKYGKRKYDYVFISPVFESISKRGHKSQYSLSQIADYVRVSKYRVIALGGVDTDKLNLAKEMGFYGVAVMGSIWQSPHPEEKFLELYDKI
jgi:thiamine-phosphate pyrophosphorylase